MLGTMSQDERTRESVALTNNLIDHLSQISLSWRSLIIGAYAPMTDEPDWTLSSDLAQLPLAFPVPKETGEGQMFFRLCQVNELLPQKAFGVWLHLPPQDAPVVKPDLALIPGLGFTSLGHRLGRGGGFYDRWLASFTGKKIGLCFERQLLQEIPIEPHDVMMDVVITNKQV
jgi:5-formyltetrahydrofolate cyclo-ligase